MNRNVCSSIFFPVSLSSEAVALSWSVIYPVCCNPVLLTVPPFQGSDEEDVALTAHVIGAFLEVGFDSSV